MPTNGVSERRFPCASTVTSKPRSYSRAAQTEPLTPAPITRIRALSLAMMHFLRTIAASFLLDEMRYIHRGPKGKHPDFQFGCSDGADGVVQT